MYRIVFSLTLSLLIFQVSIAQNYEAERFFNETNAFLSSYVKDGRVDYNKLQNEQEDLNSLMDMISNSKLSSLSDDERKAFLINTYNIAIIHAIIELDVPESPLRVEGFWDRKNIQIDNQIYSLNEIEKDLLLPVYNDSRLHFALVCAAIGCPKLQSYAYRPEELDSQLENVTIEALNDSKFTQVNHEEESVALSEIFTWYQGDFLQESESILSYVNSFRRTPIPDSYKVTSYSYDWSLNIQEN